MENFKGIFTNFIAFVNESRIENYVLKIPHDEYVQIVGVVPIKNDFMLILADLYSEENIQMRSLSSLLAAGVHIEELEDESLIDDDPDEVWFCRCGNVNPVDEPYCAKCGYSKTVAKKPIQ